MFQQKGVSFMDYFYLHLIIKIHLLRLRWLLFQLCIIVPMQNRKWDRITWLSLLHRNWTLRFYLPVSEPTPSSGLCRIWTWKHNNRIIIDYGVRFLGCISRGESLSCCCVHFQSQNELSVHYRLLLRGILNVINRTYQYCWCNRQIRSRLRHQFPCSRVTPPLQTNINTWFGSIEVANGILPMATEHVTSQFLKTNFIDGTRGASYYWPADLALF